mmetsp:Transcript_2497/g.7472  ORF Transcript_2497/g.7472 Transcript_2497/m.7472 type:complete len:82 (+) Transcript_2497:39-284(+)
MGAKADPVNCSEERLAKGISNVWRLEHMDQGLYESQEFTDALDDWRIMPQSRSESGAKFSGRLSRLGDLLKKLRWTKRVGA